MMDDGDLKELSDSIEKHGLREKIHAIPSVHEDRTDWLVLDGRNRLEALVYRRRRATIGAFAGVALAILVLLLVVRLHDSPPYSGDEPHYLLLTNSMIFDGDVDVKNDYLDGRYLRYTHVAIDPHVNTSIFTLGSPHWYSQHGVGLPAFILPGVVVEDADGASAEMVLVATIVLLLA